MSQSYIDMADTINTSASLDHVNFREIKTCRLLPSRTNPSSFSSRRLKGHTCVEPIQAQDMPRNRFPNWKMLWLDETANRVQSEKGHLMVANPPLKASSSTINNLVVGKSA
jgi:hypothetical protein